MSDPKTVGLGGQTITLGTPTSLAVRYEVAGAVSEHGLRGLAAALGVAWQAGPSPKAPKARYSKCRFDPLLFGGKVLDELLERGIALQAITEAGQVAFLVLVDGLVSTEEVDAAEGNSEAPEADSTS